MKFTGKTQNRHRQLIDLLVETVLYHAATLRE